MKTLIQNRSELDLDSMQPGKYSFMLHMTENAMGDTWKIPVMVIKGKNNGPILGVTAALHGNELNGIRVIHDLWKKIKFDEITGTIVCAPILNMPGFLTSRREFFDTVDLNRIMPGNFEGTGSERYASLIVKKILQPLNYLIDLHTASFGRINALYVRADLKNPQIYKMAELQEPQIIVHKEPGDGTLRGLADEMQIPSITVEIGDPHLFQKKHIRPSIFGLNNVLIHLGMLNEKLVEIDHDPIICKSSSWLYSNLGGILEVLPNLTDFVKEGQEIAIVSDIFGELESKIRAPYDGVVIAKSTNPVCHEGSRVIHLGKRMN